MTRSLARNGYIMVAGICIVLLAIGLAYVRHWLFGVPLPWGHG